MTVQRILGSHPGPANDQSGMRLTLVATPGSIRGAWGYAWPTMSSPALRTERALSILAVADLVAWRQQQGEALATMLEGTGIPPEALHNPQALISPLQEQAFFRGWLARDGRPHLGLIVGARYRLAHFGHLGLILPHAATGRQAIEFFLRFINLSYTHFHPEVDVAHGTLSLHGGQHLGSLRRFYLDRDIAFTVALLKAFLPPGYAPLRRICVEHQPAPEALAADTALYTHALGAPVQWGAPLTQLHIDPRQLDTPLPEANALLVQMLQPQCEAREAQVLPTHTVSWTQRVREALARHPDGAPWPDADAVAQGLRCSKRTLRRQLALEGAHFQALSDAERSQRARQWLEGSTHELHTVATALGYSEPAALIRAYKRWFGVTPRQGRAASLAESS